MTDSLTKRQKKLLKEAEDIAATVGIDFWNVAHKEKRFRTTFLEVANRQLIRSEVVTQYTLIDELLGLGIGKYFLPGDPIVKWKTKKYQRFNFFIIERLYLTQKLALVKDVFDIPKTISSKIEAINALRNAMAHAFFPENLRVYRTKGRSAPRKPVVAQYKGRDIFTPDGIRVFSDDSTEVVNFLLYRVRRKRGERAPHALPQISASEGDPI